MTSSFTIRIAASLGHAIGNAHSSRAVYLLHHTLPHLPLSRELHLARKLWDGGENVARL